MRLPKIPKLLDKNWLIGLPNTSDSGCGWWAPYFCSLVFIIGQPLLFALTFAISTVVIACPDALGLATPTAVAKRIGIGRVFAEVMPEDKAKYVKKLQDEGKFVAMVGDGVNDAPALAQADIGVAIGAGTDVAIETAKVVLMKSDPADVLRAIKLSKATVLKMKQNLFWASIYNLLAIPVAAGILYPSFGISLRPEISALLMSLSSIIVATNAVLLNRAEKDLVSI